MSALQRLASSAVVLAVGIASTVLVMAAVGSAHSVFTVRVGYLAGLAVSGVLAAIAFITLTLLTRPHPTS